MVPIFTIDWEDWHHGLHIFNEGHSSIVDGLSLIELLNKYHVKAIIYVLGRFGQDHPDWIERFKKQGHVIKSHSFYHDRGEYGDRYPYAWLGFTGGFYFRFFPYWFIKWQVLKHKHFYIHPHDLDERHPKLKNPWLNWKRHVGLKTARKKLERLLSEIRWVEASQLQKS